MIEEIWKFHPKCIGYYLVSTFGRVKSVEREIYREYKNGKKDMMKTKERIMKMTLTFDGYHQLCVRIEGKVVCVRTHRFVAETFIPNLENKPEVNHKDGIKTHNFVDNLEWVTAKENVRHAFDTGLNNIQKGENARNVKLTDEKVLEIKIKLKDGASQKELANEYGVGQATISNINTGYTWSHVKLPEEEIV
jgi:hypothetical protein